MAHAFAKEQSSYEAEYSVYIYHYPENQHEGQNDWEMRTSTSDLDAALHKAQSLYASQSYRKVEVKQRFMDPKTDKMRDATLKVFAHETNPASMSAWVLASGVVLSATAASYFLFQFFL